MHKDVKQYDRSCNSCQRNRSSGEDPAGYLQPLPIPPFYWHTITMDFAGPLPTSNPQQHDMIIIVVDKLTKRAHLIPSHSNDTAADTAQLIFDHVIQHHGMPRVIISDRESKFTSVFWKTLFQCFGVKLSMSTLFHPQTDGQSERMVQKTKEMLPHYVIYWQDNWLKQLPALEFANNSACHPPTGMSPFDLNLGQQPLQPIDCLCGPASELPALEDFIMHLQSLQIKAQEAILASQQSQARYYDRNRHSVCIKKDNLVMVSTSYIHPPFVHLAQDQRSSSPSSLVHSRF